ncbi:MAG: hypothetical protein EBX52_11460 [Proteobacteria bacterium]|nr:hypothetical protein [Pseudomonadota bacterium]
MARTYGNDALRAVFSNEQGRTQFLVRAINDYYIATQHRSSILGILRGYGKEFGLRCELKVFGDGASAIQYISEKNSRGVPVLISFYIGPQMATSDFTLQDLSAGRFLLDSRLWTPRKIGERNSGGHSVVAIASFEAKGRPRFLMLDSDWEQPRVWDADRYFGERTKMPEVEFYSCE